jgi:hypothetical protein
VKRTWTSKKASEIDKLESKLQTAKEEARDKGKSKKKENNDVLACMNLVHDQAIKIKDDAIQVLKSEKKKDIKAHFEEVDG